MRAEIVLIYTEWFPVKCLVHNMSSIKTGRSGSSWGCWLVTVIELAGVTAPFLLTEVEIAQGSGEPSQGLTASRGVSRCPTPWRARGSRSWSLQTAENPLFRPGAAPENSACAGVHCLLSTREPETPLFWHFSKLNQTLELQ